MTALSASVGSVLIAACPGASPHRPSVLPFTTLPLCAALHKPDVQTLSGQVGRPCLSALAADFLFAACCHPVPPPHGPRCCIMPVTDTGQQARPPPPMSWDKTQRCRCRLRG